MSNTMLFVQEAPVTSVALSSSTLLLAPLTCSPVTTAERTREEA